MRQVRVVSVIIRNPEAPCVVTLRGEAEVSRGHSVYKTEGPNVEVSGGLS
jgi:hypothetical protein